VEQVADHREKYVLPAAGQQVIAHQRERQEIEKEQVGTENHGVSYAASRGSQTHQLAQIRRIPTDEPSPGWPAAMQGDALRTGSKKPFRAEFQPLPLIHPGFMQPTGDGRRSFRRPSMLTLPALGRPAVDRPIAALVLFTVLALGQAIGFTAAVADDQPAGTDTIESLTPEQAKALV
ncbi:MAG: hypothetical protein ACK56I_36665, partial [bacterium]